MSKYEIWIGYYSLGQGMSDSTEPNMIAEEEAIDFEVACLKYELKSKLTSIEEQEKQGYVDSQSKEWFYYWKDNSNGWTGKYYKTRQEALKSFTPTQEQQREDK